MPKKHHRKYRWDLPEEYDQMQDLLSDTTLALMGHSITFTRAPYTTKRKLKKLLEDLITDLSEIYLEIKDA